MKKTKNKVKKALSNVTQKVRATYQAAHNLLFKRLPASVGTPLAVFLAVAPLMLAGAAYLAGLNKHPSSYTVMITNFQGNSGGSGVVISNTPSESTVLTNKHVCDGALQNGGKIRLVSGEEHMVTGYLTGIEHDLCVLTVASDLKNSIKVASRTPDLYSEATITGHPALMPNVITNGHFGGRQIITIMTGVRKCTKKDLEDPELGIFCMFFGVIPIIENFESQIVTATIMPGSSGSAVLNSSGELSGLVFAGNSRGISYAYIVPFEAVQNFLNNEAPALKKVQSKLRPWGSVSNASEEEEESSSIREIGARLKDQCLSKPKNHQKVRELCEKVILNDIRL